MCRFLFISGRVSYHCPAENASSVQEMMKTLSALLNTPQPSTEQATCVNKGQSIYKPS